jgi:PAS domain S-box-containing protein
VNEALQGLTEEYASTLRQYLADPQEAGLMRAYELGRRALAQSVGAAELATVHAFALAAALEDLHAGDAPGPLIQRSAKFLGETMAPFEMVQRGYREANELLQRLNATLEGRVKERTQALRESEERYRDLFENAGDLIQAARPDGRLLFVNRAWRSNLGYDENEVAGLSLADIVHRDHQDAFMALCRRALAGEDLAPAESVFVTKDGRSLVVEGTVNCHYVEGKPIATRGIFRDITQRKRVDEERKAAAQRKDEFLAILAHELRNPLAPVRNALQIMRLAGHDDAVIARTRDMMERQLHILVRLIDDLMDVSRISQGKIELRKERVNLAAIVQSALEISTTQVEAARHQLTVTLPAEPVCVQADLARMAQVLANLLNNAAKYTEPGGRIGLIAERAGDQAVFRVRDTGIGIPTEMLPHVFDMFVQVSSSMGRSQGGLGIGLTLVKRLVEMHGGSVVAHSAGFGQGCEFVVRLPLAREGLDQVEAHQPAPQSGGGSRVLRVLVVDDNRASAESLGLLMKLAGHQVRVVYDGPAALEAARAFEPVVILLDIEMPKMNGYEVARRIRAQTFAHKVLLVAMTGYGSAADRRRCLEAGFDHHLVKPVEFDDLQQLLATLESPP